MAREITNKDVVVQVPTIVIDPNDLKAAFLKWETAYRLGEMKPYNPGEKTAERSAETSAATLWNYLIEA
jgi:hypothetical protein